MSIDDIKRFVAPSPRIHHVDLLIEQGALSDDDVATLREAVDAVRARDVTISAVWRWLNSKDGVAVSQSAVRNWLLAQP